MKTLIATIAVALALIASPAAATRGLDTPAGHKDRCRNIPGIQAADMLVGISAPYRFDTSTPRPNDCVAVTRVKDNSGSEPDLPYPRLGHCTPVKP